MRKIVLFIIGILFLCIQLGNGQNFMKFKDSTSNVKWHMSNEEFKASCILLEDKLPIYSDGFSLDNKVYFDDASSKGNCLGLLIDVSTIDSIVLIVNGMRVNPFADTILISSKGEHINKLKGNMNIINITNVVKTNISLLTAKRFPVGSSQYKSVVDSLAGKCFTVGGELDIVIKYTNKSLAETYRLIPQKFGFYWVMTALPVNAFVDPSLNSTTTNSVSLYYPIQYVIKDLNRDQKLNWTSFSDKFSFGPFFLFTVGGRLNFVGGGGMVTFGPFANGQPLIGAGIAYTNTYSGPQFIFSINAIEAVHLFTNLSELFNY